MEFGGASTLASATKVGRSILIFVEPACHDIRKL
jgi:hypothetical protein